MYGTLFMMAGAYTLAKAGHVRGDVLYGFFRPRTQATIDLILYILFFIPGVFALTYAGYFYAAESWAIRETLEHHRRGPADLPVQDSAAARRRASCCVQGIVEIIRCVICIKQGEWPSREEDVQEVDVDKLKEMVHVKDEDIAKLDQFVVPQGKHEMKIRKELWFGFALMAIILIAVVVLTPWASFVDGHLEPRRPGRPRPADAGADRRRHHAGLPDRVHADGHGRVLRLARLSQRQPALAKQQILDLMVQRAYSVMSNDVLIAIPLFVFMGYLVERAQPDREAVQEPAPLAGARARARSRWRRSSPARSSPPRPASSARW